MTSEKRTISFALNIFVSSIMMYYVTQNVRAYIGMSYPQISGTTVTSLITIPTAFALIISFFIGPLAMKFNKVRLLTIVMLCMGIYSIIFFVVGITGAPFWLLIVACAFAGFAQGGFAPLINTIIAENWGEADRANRISRYNIALNVGLVIELFLSGRIAAGNNGANWPYAYLLGLYCFVSLGAFLILIKKSGYRDDPQAREAREAQNKANNVPSPKLKDVPKKSLAFIVLIGVLHCVFYIGINAYYTNVSVFIISEHQLGSSIEVANATSLARFTLIIMMFLYPVFAKVLKDWMIPAGYGIVAVALFVMMHSDNNIWGIYLTAFLVGLATSLVHSTIYAKALNYVPQSIAAISSSIMWGIGNAGPFFATYILAFLSNTLGGGMITQIKAGIGIAVFTTIAAIIIFVVKKPVKTRNAH